jgi:prepilin-type N-terminal cleavage/methylation domain-containing protein
VRRAAAGFTLVEVAMAIVVAGVLMRMSISGIQTFDRQQRAERMARGVLWEVTVARSYAIRAAMPMALVADSANQTLIVRDAYGTVYRTLSFGSTTAFTATRLVINTAGDSLAFSSRGLCLNCSAGGTTTITTQTPGWKSMTMKVGVLGRAELVGLSRT